MNYCLRQTGRDLGIKKWEKKKKNNLQNTKSDRLKSSQRGYYVYLYIYKYIYIVVVVVVVEVVVVVSSLYIYIYIYMYI